MEWVFRGCSMGWMGVACPLRGVRDRLLRMLFAVHTPPTAGAGAVLALRLKLLPLLVLLRVFPAVSSNSPIDRSLVPTSKARIATAWWCGVFLKEDVEKHRDVGVLHDFRPCICSFSSALGHIPWALLEPCAGGVWEVGRHGGGGNSRSELRVCRRRPGKRLASFRCHSTPLFLLLLLGSQYSLLIHPGVQYLCTKMCQFKRGACWPKPFVRSFVRSFICVFGCFVPTAIAARVTPRSLCSLATWRVAWTTKDSTARASSFTA